MANSADTIFDERDDYMVSPSPNGYVEPIFRLAHFLKPSVSAIEGSNPELSSNNPPSLRTISRPENLPLKVKFNGWRNPVQKWNSWVDRLCSTHGSTWKEAGIFEPIMASRYHIQKNKDLIFGLVEKWCPETNSFVFKWGEATISLEDMMILGGYSVLGDSVLIPIETEDMSVVRDQLNTVRLHLHKTKSKKASHNLWINYFMDENPDFEHEAFLSLWLSRYVFPSVFDTVLQHLFPLAIHLARGTRIALAPAILAAMYRDLGLLKAAIDDYTVSKLTLRAPFQFVQAWIWERFVTLRPGLDYIEPDMPRLARWHGKYSPPNSIFDLNSSGVRFQWRPYTETLQNLSFPKFYAERETRVIVSPNMDAEFASFARCVRVSKLVGIGCIEQYLPHRVAMQFGMDQDIPALVPRFNESLESAWNNYIRPIVEADLYIPSRLFKSDVSLRYAEWWTNSHVPQFTPMISKGCSSATPGCSRKLGLSDDALITYNGVEIHIDVSSDDEDRQ